MIPAIGSAQTDAENAELRARVAELERQVKALAEELTQAGNGHEAPTIGASREGFQLRSADGNFLLRLRGLVQSDGRFFENDRSDTAADTFVMRRVRPILEATMFKNFDFRLMPDFGGGTTVVQDAYLDLRFTNAFKVRAGKYKEPFGLERLASASDLEFVERGYPTSVAPNRDVGVMAYGDVFATRLSYFIGAFNGVVDGGSADFDDRDGKDVVARLFSHPFRSSKNVRLQGLGVGVAASYGTQRGTTSAPALAVYRTSGQQVFFRYLSDGTAANTVLADGKRRRISAQGYYYAGRLGLLGEQVYSSQELRRGSVPGEGGVNSWQLSGSWVLTGENASYRGVAPKTAFEPASGTWGAFEVTARVQQLRLDEDLFPLFASPTTSAERARAGALGLNWYLNRNVKIVFDYEETRFTGGSASGDRAPARELMSRLQFSF